RPVHQRPAPCRSRLRADRGRRADGQRRLQLPRRPHALRRREALGPRPRGPPVRDRGDVRAAPPDVQPAPARIVLMRISLLAAAAALALACAWPASSAGRVPLDRLVGQTVMTRVDGTTATPAFLARVRRGEVGGGIVLGDNFRSVAGLRSLIASLQTAAKAGGTPPLLIAIDQEGGIVKRLADGPPSLSPREMGSAAVARSQGAATGSYLRRLGIDVD